MLYICFVIYDFMNDVEDASKRASSKCHHQKEGKGKGSRRSQQKVLPVVILVEKKVACKQENG